MILAEVSEYTLPDEWEIKRTRFGWILKQDDQVCCKQGWIHYIYYKGAHDFAHKTPQEAYETWEKHLQKVRTDIEPSS